MITGFGALIAESISPLVAPKSSTSPGPATANSVASVQAAAFVASLNPDAATMRRAKKTGPTTNSDPSKADKRKKDEELDEADKDFQQKRLNVVA